MARPSSPLFQTETKSNFVVGFSFTIFTQPPLFNSAWQLEHHGAQRWTTLRPGALIASASCCSAGEAAKRAVPEVITDIKRNKRRRLFMESARAKRRGRFADNPICGENRAAQDAQHRGTVSDR